MNRFAFIDEDSPTLSFYKTRNKKKITICGTRLDEEKEKEFTQINYMYLEDQPPLKGAYSKNNVLSYIDSGFFTGMVGNKYRGIRHAVNHCKDKIRVERLSIENLDDVLEMIEKWRYDEYSGLKYGWQEHAGIDKALVTKIVNGQADLSLFGIVFYYNDECVAYATSSYLYKTENEIPEFHYITRKVWCGCGLKHLTEFVDWYMFKTLYGIVEKDFIVNWGCSDGGVYWYKTHKWPLYKLDKKWFVTIKNKV